jgi:hypothetical protein
MTSTAKGEAENTKSKNRWSLIGLSGAVSLCCRFAAPAATGAAGATVAGGATAAFGGGLIRILVSAIGVGIVGIAIQLWPSSSSCER